MKKCPTCDKTFDGEVRFCQTDGTPLVEVAEEAPQAFDPLKTMVVSPQDLPELVKDDPMKTMVVGPADRDILDIPSKPEAPQTAPVSEPVVRAEEPPVNFNDTLAQTPDLPKFSEPSLSPPDLGGIGLSAPLDPVKSEPAEQPGLDSVAKPDDASLNVPPSPFDAPPPSPFAQNDEPMFGGKEPPTDRSPFSQPSEPLNAPPPAIFAEPEPIQQAAEWAPPPAPVAEWQDQSVGQNTPFQPPVAGTGTPNQTLAIVSLVTGILSLICCSWFIPGIAAVVMGFIAKSKATSNPAEYGGAGLALGGIITGGISIVLGIIVVILYLAGAIAANF